MKVRIRKAGPGETPGYKNGKLSKFIPKAENGMEVENMEMNLVKSVYKAMMTSKIEPQKLYEGLLTQGVEPPMALRVIKKASMFAQEGEQENAQVEQAQQVTQEEDAATQRAIEEEAAKQAQWEKIKMSNDNLNEEGAEEDEQNYEEDLQQQQDYQDEDDAESDEEFNNMLFDDSQVPQQKYGGLARAQFGYDVVNQRGNQEAPSLTQDELVEQVFKMYKGNENMIPNELDRLIAQTPGAQNINFPGIEKYIPNYAPIFLSEGNSPREGIDLPEPMMAKRGGINKRQFKNELHKFFAEGGEEDPNAEQDPEAEKETKQATALDTINGDVAKRHDGFLKALSFEAKEKVFNDFMAKADPEIQNVEFMKDMKPQGSMEQEAPMAQDGYTVPNSDYMVPENDFTHYTHGTDDIFHDQMNEYVGQTGGFVDPDRPDLNKFVYGGPDYMDKNTSDPYSKDEFASYGKYGVSVGNIKMQDGGGSGMGRMAADDADYESIMNQSFTPPNSYSSVGQDQKRKVAEEKAAYEWNVLKNKRSDGSSSLVNYAPNLKDPTYQKILNRHLAEQGITDKNISYDNIENQNKEVRELFDLDDPNVIAEKWNPVKDESTDPYDMITDERINYKYVPGGSGRVGLMNALLPWNPFRTVQRYSYDMPYDNLGQIENLRLGQEQYSPFNIRNLDNIGMRGGKKLMKKLGKEIQKLQKGLTQRDETHNISFNQQVRDYFGDDKKGWRELGPQGRRASRNAFRSDMEYQAGKNIPKDEPEYNDMNEGIESYVPKDGVQRFDLGGQSFDDRFGGCPPGSKKDPISGLCRDTTGNTVSPTFISDATKNFDEFSKDINDQYENPYKYTTDMFTGDTKEKEGLFTNPYTDQLNMNQPKFDYTPPVFNKPKQNGKLKMSGKLVTTDYESGVNVANAGIKKALGLVDAFGTKKAQNQMLLDNSNIMNLASRSVRQDLNDHQDLGSAYGGFRTYGAEQQGRGAFGKEGGTFKRGGSQMEYSEGDELYMTEAEIAEFIKNGGKLEFV
tara:strand:+ start:1057 stop:4113 length:3057 start_codon:yes stop_codon:yes gene_type:complete